MRAGKFLDRTSGAASGGARAPEPEWRQVRLRHEAVVEFVLLVAHRPRAARGRVPRARLVLEPRARPERLEQLRLPLDLRL